MSSLEDTYRKDQVRPYPMPDKAGIQQQNSTEKLSVDTAGKTTLAKLHTSDEAVPMGTSFLIGSFKRVRPKKQKMKREPRKSHQSTTPDLQKQNEDDPEPELSQVSKALELDHASSEAASVSNRLVQGPLSPALESTLLPTDLLSSPVPSSKSPEETKHSATPHSAKPTATFAITPNQETPDAATTRATPSSQPRSTRRSSRRTGTTSSRLEKARKLFQDAEEIFSPPATVANKPEEERTIKDFELDYDSTATEVKMETRSQLLAKQRKGQVLGNSELERGAKSSLPLRPSTLAQSPQEQKDSPTAPDSTYSTHTRTWSASLSAVTPPFIPQGFLPENRAQVLSRDIGQEPDRAETYSNRMTGPIDTQTEDPVEGLPTHQSQTRALIDGQGRHMAGIGFIGSLAKQGLKSNNLQTFSHDFGILPGSEEESQALASGRVRNWTLSQLGKGRPSIAPSDRLVEREPSILELVHAHMESSDGVVLTRQPVSPIQVKRRTASSGSLSYVDPQRRLRSVTLTSIPAEGESEEELSKRSMSKKNKHGRSHTSAEVRSTHHEKRPVQSMIAQPESITTSSDVEDHSAHSDTGGTLSGISATFGLGRHRKTSSEYSGQVSDVETEIGDREQDKGTADNPRKLTGISPAMRRDFQGRILQFGIKEEDHQPLKVRMTSSASSVASIASTHGSVVSPASPGSHNIKTSPSSQSQVSDTRTCDTCGRPTATVVLTLMEPCYHLACFDCLNAVLNTVCSNGPGGNPGRSRCSSFGCGKETVGIVPYLLATQPVRQQAERLEDKETQLRLAFDALPDENEETVVVRMDNVAWDVTPEAVVAFLPPHTLADDLIQNVHIMLDRNDGKAKDYLFFECRDRQAATQVLRSRQNAVLGQPPRARPVTLTLSTHAALITELRPSGPRELENLMLLCRSIDIAPESTVIENAAGLQTPQQTPRRQNDSSVVASPAQSGRFLKSPLAPYHSLMSLLSKIAANDEHKASGSKNSVIYWDLFACSAGAISVLAKRTLAAHRAQLPPTPPASRLDLSAKPASTIPNQMIPTPQSSNTHVRTESQIQRSSIEAKIKEKLERDQARQGGPTPIGTPKAPGRARIEPVTPGKTQWSLESPQYRAQEEALAHLLIGAFEKTFGLRINQGVNDA